ncbi:MAG: T9SS type A sorting domain-containing protein [Gemmatimonadales bacterium]|nr:T9SS type A sorting domain-containing protein [Gemmatimonadales bacterium]
MMRHCGLWPDFFLLTLFLIIFSLTNSPGSVAFASEPTDPDRAIQKAPGDGTTLESSVLSAAGAPASSRNFQGNGTLGQSTPIGICQDTDRTLSAGFWYGWLRLLDPSDVPEPLSLVNKLMQNYPNPFNPMTVIRFAVAKESTVDLKIFDLRGRQIRVLTQNIRPPGNYQVYWDGTDQAGLTVSSGTYFYRLQVGDFSETNKMLLLK